MSLESQLSRAGYAYDNRLPDEDTAAEAAYRELERITDDPDELEEALVEDGTDRGLARLIVALYYTADAKLRGAVDRIVEGVIKQRGEVKTRVRQLEKACQCRLPDPESAETSREGHNTESMK